MAESRALGTVYNHSSAMYNPAQVSGMFRVGDLVGRNDKLRHNIVASSFTAQPLDCGSWFNSHFDSVMTQFIISKRTDA